MVSLWQRDNTQSSFSMRAESEKKYTNNLKIGSDVNRNKDTRTFIDRESKHRGEREQEKEPKRKRSGAFWTGYLSTRFQNI